MNAMKKAFDQNHYSKGYSFARDIWGHELRIYPEIKKITDTAVLSVIILIAFLVPWAYFLERIIIQSRSINGQLAGFLGFFALGTSFIYFLHPAFQLSMSPLMILIAYSLGGMALLALNIIFKKYKSVIKQWRIRIGGIHSSDISRSSAFAMAFNLGLTSMAKRPLRTSLVIIMVSLLVFSVNTFILVI